VIASPGPVGPVKPGSIPAKFRARLTLSFVLAALAVDEELVNVERPQAQPRTNDVDQRRATATMAATKERAPGDGPPCGPVPASPPKPWTARPAATPRRRTAKLNG
jgi:hypothetical protein